MTTEPTDFVLPVDKPVGPTSHDLVASARRAFGTRRIGHTGTLDPFASGLLLLCVNGATRTAEYLAGLPKTYTGTVRLDALMDSDDRTGNVIQTFNNWQSLERAQVERALQALTGDLDQVPPQYSAKKVGGERMYARARRGESVSLTPVRVQVTRFELHELSLPELHFEVDCSSGTYIRALARDLGRLLDTGGHLSALRRTRIGAFQVERAVNAAQFDDAESVARARVEVLNALAHLPRYNINPEDKRRLISGQAIRRPPEFDPRGPIVVAADGRLIALARVDAGWIRPSKVWPAGG